MAKRKKRVVTSKKKKLDDSDENPGGEEVAPSAKKVAASSTSYLEDDVSQNSSFSSIETTEMSKGAFGFSSHFWCNYCEFSADTKQELVTHMRQHMIKCSFCKYSSLSQADVTKHEKCEHGDNEVEVDSSSSSTDYNMDKDPCCACVFCDFMTYSTEYLEKHTISKHRGMLPKSVAKMISKPVSAKVRQADALFYTALSNERTEISHLEKELLRNPESPSSSNVIVIEEENKNSKAVKPEVKDLLLLPKVSIKDETITPQVSSCVKHDPSVERAAEKLASEISKALYEKESPSDWKVKVETMYCPCCPFSNVSIEKLKCHTFSQHVRGPAIARNNSCETAMDVPDVTFFCVKETCFHSTNTCSLYEEHLMSCCAVHQTLQDDELGRLRATLTFLLDFHKKHCLKTASGFLDFVSSVNKMQVSENVSIESVAVNVTERNLEHHSSEIDNVTMSQKKLSCSPPANTLPVLENQHYSRTMGNSSHPLPNALTQVGNQPAQLGLPTERNSNNQSVRGNLPNQPLYQRSTFLTSSNDCGITYDNSSRFQSSARGSQDSTFPQAHKPLYNQSITGVAYENNFPSASRQIPVASQSYNRSFYTPSSENAQRSLPNTSLSQESQFGEQAKERKFQNHYGILPLNSSTTRSDNMMNASSENANPPLSNSGSFITNDKSVVGPQKAQFTPPFASAPQSLQQHQQTLTSSHNQPFQASLPSTVSNHPKMVDLLSDSYSILLDEDLNLTSALDNPIPGDSSAPLGGPTVHGNPASCNLLDVSVQQPVSSVIPSTVSEHSEIPYPPVTHIQQSTPQASSSQQPVLGDVVPQQSSLPINHHGQRTVSFSNAMTTQTPSQDFMSLPTPSYPSSSFTHQHTNVQQMNPPYLQQPSTTVSQYPSPSVLATSGHMGVSSPQVALLKTAQDQQGQPESALFPTGQSSAAYSVPITNATPNSMQTSEDISHGQSFNTNIANPQSSMPSFLETSSGSAQPAQPWQGNRATDIPNFLVPSQTSVHDTDPTQAGPECFSNQEAQSGLPPHPNNDALSTSNQVTPVKNQSVNFARNMVGNSPLSPSIYLNGQAPRHNRSNWTTTDMMPRGAALPQIRPQAAARYPSSSSVRQNLFSPYQYRGRGRPRGPRLQTRLPNPDVRPQDDDVIVTAVVRGPQQQPQRRPIRGRGGMMRGQRRPMPQGPRMGGPGRGMIRNPSNVATALPSKKPFDVSKHFVDLACVVNTTNDDGEDEIQIMGMTPGNNANTHKAKGPPKVVDARKFSFCCVHCGRDQGSKQIMKQHMKANHNDSLLGAFRNVDTGQFLFFCPQLRCEFMTYDENRLTDHLFSCYNLDKSKQLPFDLQSALKNLRSLKIRKVNTSANMGGSQTNPIDLDGQGLRDTFNNNLTDAFDDMVENTIGRHMTKPSSGSQPTANPPAFPPQGRPPGHIRPQRGRPIGNNLRMPRASYYHPRQAEMALRSPGQGNVRMPPSHQPYRMPGRRNFRSPGPRNMIPSGRGPAPLMSRPYSGHPPNPRPFMTNSALGNEDQPILIDIDSERPEPTTIPQNFAVLASSQPGFASESTSSPEVSQNPSVDESGETVGTDKAPTIDQPISGPYMEVEVVPSQTISDTAMQQDQPNEGFASEVSSISGLPTSSVDSQFVSASNSYNTTMHNEDLTIENKEEQVNAILLDKVFAKVPHMPKKLSQRLVLRFKEFAAKRGVVITPTSKVIDEFVERISYKGSNPLSKQQQQPQQQQYSSSAVDPSTQTQQDTASGSQGEPSSEYGNTSSNLDENASLQQSQPHASQNQLDVSRNQHSSDTLHSSNQFGGSGNQSIPSSFQAQTHSGDTENQVADNSPLSQNHPGLSENENYPNSSQSHNQMSFSPSQNETEWKDKQADNHSDDDHDVVETKVILPPRDLKFAGGFADIAKSAIDHGKTMVKSGLRRTSSSSSSRSASPLDAGSRINSNKPAGSLQNSFACLSPNIPSSIPTNMLTQAENDKGASLALREQVTINEKLLKKELLPIAFPMTREGETILVQSSVDHIVSGNESLEVDIAGKPLDSNNLFKAESRSESIETADELGKILEDVEMGKSTKEKSVESVIDKSSGRLVLKVKKGVIPRRRNDLGTYVVTQVEEDRNIDSENGETFIRRSERKRKIRHCEMDEDVVNELDRLISDDDDEYQVESEDESYDDSDYERGHSNKKKSKTPKDPDAFDVNQKGPYVCWVCYKRFARCFGVKKHICQKHSKALCAIVQAEAGDTDALFHQLILFCPRNCKYATSKVEAFSNHIINCQKGEITADGQNLVEMQNAFILLEYVELQGHIASGAMTEMIKQKSPSTSGKKRQRSVSLPEAQMEKDQVTEMAPPIENSSTGMMPPPLSQ